MSRANDHTRVIARKPSVARRVIVPVALAVTAVSAAIAASTTVVGCNGVVRPHVDANRDTPPDTPLG